MIVKKIKNSPKKQNKLKAWQIGDLVDYIRNPHIKNKHEKIEYSGGKNFFSRTHAGQKLEMISLANESVHSKMPVQHWMFSWREGEQPTPQQIEEVVDIFLEKMGLVGHQTIYGLHCDTHNYHLHISVNRTHPETFKVIQPHGGFDIKEAHKILALVEHKQGWSCEDNALYTVLEDGEITRVQRQKIIKPKQPAIDFECAKGEKSAQRIAQERGYSILKNAKSWGKLHAELAQHSMRLEKKGSGAIIFVGEIAIKASSVDRAFSMKNLCKRLGDFIPCEFPDDIKCIPPEPVSSVSQDEWQIYQSEQYTNSKAQHVADKNTLLEKERSRQRIERKNILSKVAKHGLSILNIASHALKVQHKKQIRQLYKAIPKLKDKKKPRFETWLRMRGLNQQADRWRYRSKVERQQVHAIQENPMPILSNESISFDKYAIAVNADRYRVTCIKMDSDEVQKTFILDKKNNVTTGFTADELISRIPEMQRLQQRGENIYYTPLSEKRHHILIDDMTVDTLKKLREDGFSPAVILESSQGNFQCILTIPKLGNEFDKDVGNQITGQLNRMYGDKKLSGCIHPHRAPGFENRKHKHQTEHGSFPKVKLLYAEKHECSKAFNLSKELSQIYANMTHQKAMQTVLIKPQAIKGRPTDPFSAYHAHLNNIRQYLTIEDYSRVDSMIALRMRSNGHSQHDVTEAIRQCAPTIRDDTQERRDWQKYAERTAAYAFGVAGDIDLIKNERYKEHWQKMEEIKEPQPQQSRMRMK